MARQSFFAEKRSANNNPNFFNNMSVDEIRKSVKRIIRDIKFDNIAEQDYLYFTNEKVLSACLTESYVQYQTASVLVNALNYYIQDGLISGFVPYRTTDINQERALATNEQTKQNDRCYNWLQLYQMFNAIYNGADVISTLKNIQLMNLNVNYL
jgi:hypothetical protein